MTLVAKRLICTYKPFFKSKYMFLITFEALAYNKKRKVHRKFVIKFSFTLKSKLFIAEASVRLYIELGKIIRISIPVCLCVTQLQSHKLSDSLEIWNNCVMRN